MKFIFTLISFLIFSILNSIAQDTIATNQDDTLNSNSKKDPIIEYYTKDVSANFTTDLMGNTSGLLATLADGQPGSTSNLYIRGIISDSTAPLILLNEMPYFGKVNDINPDIIKSIDVRKSITSFDAPLGLSNNKVIAITTKQSVENKWNVNVNISGGFSQRMMQDYETIQDPQQFIELSWMGFRNRLVFTDGYTMSDAGFIANEFFENNYVKGYNPFSTPLKDLINPITGKFSSNPTAKYQDDIRKLAERKGFKHVYNVSADKKSKNFSMFANMAYYDENGFANHTSFERISANLNLEYQPIQKLKIGTLFNYANSIEQYIYGVNASNIYNIFFMENIWAPIFPIYYRDANGNRMNEPNLGGYRYDWGDLANYSYASIGTRAVFAGNNPIGIYNYDNYNQSENGLVIQPYITYRFLKNFTVNARYSLNYNYSEDYNYYNNYYGYFKNNGGVEYLYKNKSNNKSGDLNIAYKIAKNKSNFNSTLGYYILKMNNNINGITNTNYPPSSYNLYDITDKYNYQSIYWKTNYSFDNTYFLSAKLSYDGTSSLMPHSYYNYAVGGAIDFANILKSSNDKIYSLKLKSDYGTTGFENHFKFFNVGIDGDFFRHKLTTQINYFSEVGNNYLPIRLPSHGSTYVYNYNFDVLNKGIDFDISYNILSTKDFYWKSSFNITHLNNQIRVTDTSKGSIFNGMNLFENGASSLSFYLPESLGVDPNIGDELYKTANGTTNDYNEAIANKKNFGSAIPKLYGGWSNVFIYKNTELFFQLAYSLGGKYYDRVYQDLMSNAPMQNVSIDMLHAWTPNNTNTSIPRYEFNNVNIGNASNRFLRNSDYLMFKNVTLAYSLPLKTISKLRLSKLRIFVSGDNLFAIKQARGMNPMGTIYADYSYAYRYSPARTIMFGVNIGL